MKITNHIYMNVAVPIAFAAITIVTVATVTLNKYNPEWNDVTKNYITVAKLDSSKTKLDFIGRYIGTSFNQTKNDITAIEYYIQQSIQGNLNITDPYDTYYGISSVDPRQVPKDYLDNSIFSSTYKNGIVTMDQLYNTQYVNDTSIYDNVLRPIYKSSSLYEGVYVGFENGLFRRYPYALLNSYPTFAYTCVADNLPTVGYDPRCRIWYNIAKNDDSIKYTTPYVDSLTSKVMITSSKRVMNNSQLVGIIGMDFSMNEIDITIVRSATPNYYTFMTDITGAMVSYPNLNRNIASQTVFTLETDISASVWNSILADRTGTVQVRTVSKNGETWTIISQYLSVANYVIISMYDNMNAMKETNVLFTNIDSSVKNGTIAVSIISAVVLAISLLIMKLCGGKYTESINDLSNQMKKIENPDYDVELGNRAPISAEFNEASKNFGHLLTAVKCGNEAYFKGDTQKAYQSYQNGAALMAEMKNQRGLSICYNNMANALKQMGQNTEAENLYKKSIAIVQTQISQETDPNKKKAFKVMLSYRLMNLGVLYKDMNKFIEANEHLEQALQLARETDNTVGISKISGNLGQLYLQIGRVAEANELLYTTYDSVKTKYDPVSTQYAMVNIGLLEAHKKNNLLALQWFNCILTTHETIDPYVKQLTVNNMYNIMMLEGMIHDAETIKSQVSGKIGSKNEVLFVLDCSGSMGGTFIVQCRNSIVDIITNHLGDNDSISMYVFNNIVTEIFRNKNKITHLTQMINDVMNKTPADGQTAFYDALFRAIGNVSVDSANTQWIVSLTDGEDNQSKQTPADVIRIVATKPVNLVIIAVGKLSNKTSLQQICDKVSKTGKGVLIETNRNPQDIANVFQKVARLIRGQQHVESL
jgi:tetratricopeptide (TPR) repeat protein